MGNSFSRMVIHTVFSTRYRQKLITPDIEDSLLRLLVADLKRNNSHTLAINAVSDHVHIVHTLPRTMAVSNLIMDCKKWSTRNLKQLHPELRDSFYWQTGYAAFTVDYRRLDGLIRYVQNQKAHHNSDHPKAKFTEELVWLLEMYGIQFKAEYVFEYPDLPRAA